MRGLNLKLVNDKGFQTPFQENKTNMFIAVNLKANETVKPIRTIQASELIQGIELAQKNKTVRTNGRIQRFAPINESLPEKQLVRAKSDEQIKADKQIKIDKQIKTDKKIKADKQIKSDKQIRWTAKMIRKHQDRMSKGEVPWEEIWEVPGVYTVKEYYKMMNEDSHWELVDQKIIVHSPAGIYHQDINGVLYAIIRTHVSLTGTGLAYAAPTGLEIDGLPHKYEPDIFVVNAKYADDVKGSYCQVVPDFVVEVALTSKALNQAQDYKLRDYDKIGIQEYLVIFAEEKKPVIYYHYYRGNQGLALVKRSDEMILKSIGLAFASKIITDRMYWRASAIEEVLGSELVRHIDPKVISESVPHQEIAKHLDPKVRVDGVDPMIRVDGVDPMIRVDGVDPKVRVDGVDPKVRVDGVDPKIRLAGLSIAERLEGFSFSELEQFIEMKVIEMKKNL